MGSLRRLGFIGLASLTLLVALLVGDGFIGRGRQKAVFELMGRLERGMSRDQVIELVHQRDTSFLRLHEMKDRMVATASTGWGRGCILTIEFQDLKLSSARIRGEDGRAEVLNGAPPDIVPLRLTDAQCEAIRQAEDFIVRNGYTAAAASDVSGIVPEIQERCYLGMK